MKKYLLIFMTVVMVLTMIPMMAFADTYPKVEVIGDVQSFTTADANKEVALKITLSQLTDYKEGRVILDIKNAKIASVPSSAKATAVQGTTQISSPQLSFVSTDGNALTGGETTINLDNSSTIAADVSNNIQIFVVLKLDLTQSEEGKPVQIELTDIGKNGVATGIGNHPTTNVANATSGGKEFDVRIIDSSLVIGPAGGTLGKIRILTLDKLSNNSSNNKLVLNLPSGYMFSPSSKVTFNSGAPTIAYSGDKTQMTITGLSSTTGMIEIEPFVILEATNTLSSGNVSTGLEFFVNNNSIFKKDAVIGKLQTYGLTLTAKEQGRPTIPSLSKGLAKTVELTIKAVDGTLSNGAVVKLDVKNAEIVYNTIKVVEPAGLILTAPKSAGSNNKVSGYEVYNNSEFSLRTHKYDVQNIKVTFDVVAAEKATGNATVTASATRLDDVTIDIAKITNVLNVEITPARVEKGTKPSLPNVVIKETSSNQLQKGDKLYLELVYPGSDKDKGQHIAYEAAKDIKVATTNSLKVDTVELDKQENILILTIGSRSYEGAGTITLSNIKGFLTEKATMNQVDLQVKLNNNIEATAPFFSINNPVALKTVFVINNLSYTSNGALKQLNTAPYIKDGRTMLPVRAVGESLGLEASWDNTTKTATFKNAEKTAVVKIGSSTITVNNTPMPLTVPAEIKNGSTMIELRSLATAFGVNIRWDAVNKSVTVN
ncbi:copper amine oxidase N-terminal domain-containing protein [Bacteroides heparinolyticus]|uniref:copper amine oxidase N-terminal domain-containing protein n=1 Tax=Prevotella heparinolytica TaxID=28113 RepID=UPI0035A190C2